MLPQPRNSNSIYIISTQPHTFLLVYLFLPPPGFNVNIFGFYSDLIHWLSSISHSMLFWATTTGKRKHKNTAHPMQLLHELSTVVRYWHIKQVQARTFTYSLEKLSPVNFLCNANYVREMIDYFQLTFHPPFSCLSKCEMRNQRCAEKKHRIHKKRDSLNSECVRTHARTHIAVAICDGEMFVHENEGFSPRLLSVKLWL